MRKVKFYDCFLSILSFVRGRQGVTTIEYAVLAVTVVSIIAVVFNVNSGGFYDAMQAAKTSLIDAITGNG